MSETKQPEIIVEQMQFSDFLYLGVDYIDNDSTDFVAVWDDFLGPKMALKQ